MRTWKSFNQYIAFRLRPDDVIIIFTRESIFSYGNMGQHSVWFVSISFVFIRIPRYFCQGLSLGGIGARYSRGCLRPDASRTTTSDAIVPHAWKQNKHYCSMQFRFYIYSPYIEDDFWPESNMKVWHTIKGNYALVQNSGVWDLEESEKPPSAINLSRSWHESINIILWHPWIKCDGHKPLPHGISRLSTCCSSTENATNSRPHMEDYFGAAGSGGASHLMLSIKNIFALGACLEFGKKS